MINRAKVSLSAVKTFERDVAAVMNYSPLFNKGISCFDMLLENLSISISGLRESISSMEEAKGALSDKISEFEAEATRLTEKLNKLEDRLASLENRLIEVMDSDSAYDAVQDKIINTEMDIDSIETELIAVNQKLDQAYSVDTKLNSHIDSSNSVVVSLEEKQNLCRRLRERLEEIKDKNSQRGSIANENLLKIVEIINAYLRIKMIFENPALQSVDKTSPLIGVNVNVNMTVNEIGLQNHKANENAEQAKKIIPVDEVVKHHIQFDNNGRICRYDNKTFGGKYISYENRVSGSSDNNPMLGYYVGERGESKYIPTGRTVEGVVVIDILKQYGLDGIEYRNAEPDFEVCSEEVVKIRSMSKERENYYNSDGLPVLGNFVQADIACARKWNSQKKDGKTDWTGSDVKEYRKKNNLTWHEKCDMETVVLVRSEINLFFRHSGGCAECKARDGYQEEEEFDE